MASSTFNLTYNTSAQFMIKHNIKKLPTSPLLLPNQPTKHQPLKSQRTHPNVPTQFVTKIRYNSIANYPDIYIDNTAGRSSNDSPHNFIKRRKLRASEPISNNTSSRFLAKKIQYPNNTRKEVGTHENQPVPNADRYALIPLTSKQGSPNRIRPSFRYGSRTQGASPQISPRQSIEFSREDQFKLYQIQTELQKLRGEDFETQTKPYLVERERAPKQRPKPVLKTRFRFNVDLKDYVRRSDKVDLLMQMVEESKIERWENTDDSMLL